MSSPIQCPRPASTRRVALSTLALGLALAASGATAQANKEAPGKLYCWNEGGNRVCSDALPPSVVDRQRTEINRTSGMTMREVERALTPEEQAERDRMRSASEAQAREVQREMAMVVSYSSEEELARSYGTRFELLDESIKASALALQNLRKSLVTLLRQANESELESRPVNKLLADKIQTQRQELRALQDSVVRQREERQTLDAEYKQVLNRYRELKRGATARASGGI